MNEEETEIRVVRPTLGISMPKMTKSHQEIPHVSSENPQEWTPEHVKEILSRKPTRLGAFRLSYAHNATIARATQPTHVYNNPETLDCPVCECSFTHECKPAQPHRSQADEIRRKTGCKGGVMAEGAHISDEAEAEWTSEYGGTMDVWIICVGGLPKWSVTGEVVAKGICERHNAALAAERYERLCERKNAVRELAAERERYCANSIDEEVISAREQLAAEREKADNLFKVSRKHCVENQKLKQELATERDERKIIERSRDAWKAQVAGLAKALAAEQDKRQPLLDAIEKSVDTFADLKLGLRLLGKLDVAKVCQIAEEETRKVLANQ